MDIHLNFFEFILIVIVFAWVARALLGARELTWRRTVLATIAGMLFGVIVAAAIVVDDFDNPTNVDPTQFTILAIGLAVVGTMGAMVVLEILFTSKPKTPGSFRRIRPFRALRRWIGIWARGFQVSRILARHGLAPLVGLRRGDVSTRSPAELSRRVRISLEEAGGMFVKLGQLLVTRPDLLPLVALAELSRLQADVAPLPESQVREIAAAEIGRPLDEVFSYISSEPLGSASIGQAHAARLLDGREVVVKVRRPGLEAQVDRDLAIVRWLGGVAERRTSWGKAYNVRALVAEFSEALRSELRFGHEAQHAVEMAEFTVRFPSIKVPEIISELTTDRLLVMERLVGTPLSKASGGTSAPTDYRSLADALCKAQVGAMLHGERFHGDPHPGNVLLLEDGGLGLVDFGITGRLDTYERASVFEMLIALKLEQPAILFDALVTVGAIDAGHDPDRVQRALAQFLASHSGTGMPAPDALTDLLRLTTDMGLHLPPSTTTMFRALATLTGTLETLSPGYPLFQVVAEIGGEEIRERMAPGSVVEFVQSEWAEMGPLFRRAPHHLDRLATMAEHGRLSAGIRLFAVAEDVRIMERMLNRALTAFLSIGMGAVSVMLLTASGGPQVTGIGANVYHVLGWTGLTLAVILLLRVLLAIFRVEAEARNATKALTT
ncbi:MAG: AarF/UbiB family protein [Acidimicrobiia bacterium]